MEDIAGRCIFLFTANHLDKIDFTLRSRCTHKVFDYRDDERNELIRTFYQRAEMILRAESVSFDSALLTNVINRYYPDFRKTLNELEGAIENGTLSAAALDQY
jgi:DNA polymerase III delta prime subunit